MCEIEFSAIDENWEGFDVGSSPDFAQEVRATEQNQALFEFLMQQHSPKERTRLKVWKDWGGALEFLWRCFVLSQFCVMREHFPYVM